MSAKNGYTFIEKATGFILGVLISWLRKPEQVQDIRGAQLKVLRKILTKAKHTTFGKQYKFKDILKSDNSRLYKSYSENVPVFHYGTMYETWWEPLLHGESDHVWPGRIQYMGITSATSSGHNKLVPVSRDQIKNAKKVFASFVHYFLQMGVPKAALAKDFFIIGGSSDLQHNGSVKLGFFSGILTYTSPRWYQRFSVPGPEIHKLNSFTEIRQKIIQEAPAWDVSIMSGFPVWMVSVCEDIVSHYNLNSIHDLWPNLCMYQHGGMQMEPYRERWEKLLAKPVLTSDAYAATEGVLAFSKNAGGPLHLLNIHGFFYEFLEVNNTTFHSDGTPVLPVRTIPIWEIRKDTEYALILSNCSGAWRYVLGDTLIFSNTRDLAFRISGRTAHFFNVCGEHVTFTQVEKTLHLAAENFGIRTPEYAISVDQTGQYWRYTWFLSLSDLSHIPEFTENLDNSLKQINHDYRDFRNAGALVMPRIVSVPQKLFLSFLQRDGQDHAQLKFPRFIKGDLADQWYAFLAANGIEIL